ncbi:creatininase family protein [Microlunatus soli]|uniref:Creatinine amidohydrolase n=1 Tax=Microlunatus soli TaxID=630515 RepID=A0A1H1Z188_9ACTN|nr:creatininase family protein [Microlunatus soli]SDT27460.1 creatinine amidohydrolase [Microlunatus soli]
MTVLHWNRATRAELTEVLPEALVLLAVGATEQHGPHLPTGTDILLSEAVTESAAERAVRRSTRQLVIAPPLPVGASDHHRRFGGTLSLRPTTMITVLTDLIDSIVAAGGRRLMIINGHGGNIGVCHAAAGAAAAGGDVSIAVLDYWRLVEAVPDAPGPVPGHAGWFETSLVLAVRPDLVRDRKQRAEPVPIEAPSDVDLHSAAAWTAVNGYTDRPELADDATGRRLLEQIVIKLSDRIVGTAAADITAEEGTP